jgi:hypothetical protein
MKQSALCILKVNDNSKYLTHTFLNIQALRMHIPWSFRRGGHNLSCYKHHQGNIDMRLKEVGFEDVHLNLLAQQSTSGVLL